MRFNDPKSRRQVAAFRTHELHAARWRNAKNLERWNEACRSRWELAQLGAVSGGVVPVDYDRGLPVG